ncbi:MAG: 2-oxoglutarate and iron-dependent oxygenase domain-containing protein, partial [Xanthomonadales bacterium]|nr:2-oxoglutarate and iron-dependent oxygenase domain-containing protein [Xanthomonadales bacterium]
MTDQVPTLDLEEFETDREAFVMKLGEAYEKWGFCGVKNHGLPDEIVANAYREFKAFFALPREVKEKYAVEGGGGARGYTGFGVETAKDSDHPDLKEFWQIGRELPDDHPFRERMPPNLWPAEVPGFKEHGYRLYTSLDDLGRRMLQAMAIYLDQDEHYFDENVNLGNSILRPIHYPPIKDNSTPSVRAGRHEDINLITLLIGADGPGLEILTRKGDWLPVTTIPGA